MTEEAQATINVAGRLHQFDGKGVVHLEGRYDTDVDDLWSALTEPPRLARWFAQVDGQLRQGGEFEATFTSNVEATCRIDVCEPPKRLLVTMSPQLDNETLIVAELVADGDQTILTIEERGLPLDEAADHGAGWQAHLEDLAGHLAGQNHVDWHARWAELAPSYRAMSIDPA
jgi:uncharacterized protein YndB with AHSA1/START domain